MRGSRTRSAAGLAGLSAALVLASAAAATTPDTALHRQANALSLRAQRALLDLYSIDARIQSAQARLAALHAASARLAGEQALLARQIAATHETLRSSRSTLGDNLRMLYKQGDVSALAVVFGAQSVDDAVTRLDTLTSVADQSRRIVEVAVQARARLENLRTSMRRRRERLASATIDARRAAATLFASYAEHVAFITDLRSRERLKSAQIAALQSAARRAAEKSALLQAAAATMLQPLPDMTAPASPAPAPGGAHTITVSSTGYSLAGRTATGMPAGWGVVAVDPSVIPLGTRLTIPGYGEAVAADTGSAVRGTSIDLWFPTAREAGAWGRRTVTITLH